MEAGADDIDFSAEAVEIYMPPTDFLTVRKSLEDKGYAFASAELEYIPSTYVALSADDKIKMERLMDMLDDNDDIQNYWHNWEDNE